MNSVIIQRIVAIIAVALSLLVILVASSEELLAFSANNLAFHMTVEHIVFFSTGAVFVVVMGRLWFLARKNPLSISHRNIQIITGITVSAILLGIWHFPPFFAAAVVHEELHMLQHLSFLAVGAFAMIAIKVISVSHLLLSMVVTNALMGLSGLLLVLPERQVFFPYSIDSHIQAGNVMIILATAMGIIALPAFLIARSLRYELKEHNSL